MLDKLLAGKEGILAVKGYWWWEQDGVWLLSGFAKQLHSDSASVRLSKWW